MRRHYSQVPSGRWPSPCSHMRAFARMRAMVVLPVPRGPQKRYAWLVRPSHTARSSVETTCAWPTTCSNVCGRYLRYSDSMGPPAIVTARPRRATPDQTSIPGPPDALVPDTEPAPMTTALDQQPTPSAEPFSIANAVPSTSGTTPASFSRATVHLIRAPRPRRKAYAFESVQRPRGKP